MSLEFERISVIGAGAMGAVYASKFYDMDKSGITPHCRRPATLSFERQRAVCQWKALSNLRVQP